jgi:hypothetical protein
MRVVISGCLAWLLLLCACSSSDPTAGSAAGGASAAGSASTAGGASNAGGASVGASGAGSAGGAGASAAAGAGSVAGAAPVNLGGSGGGDNGGLFPPGSDVPIAGAVGTGGSGGAPATGVPGDGNTVTAHIGGSASGTAVFTQHGTDVTVVVSLNQCPSGTLGVFIMGLSCDNNTTEGSVWDGKRGYVGDTGAITCNNNKATLTYTRSNADPTTSWTVADHNPKTDLSQYVVIITSSASPTASHIACGNFFS